MVPPVLSPIAFEQLMSSESGDPVLMLVEPSLRHDALTIGALPDDPRPAAATVVVGPEGGWSEDELRIGSAASRLVTLGERTLRADAMALVVMAALYTVWKEF
jgi:16S rRNA (uracil1498-N3)-methyltransferase